MPQRISNEDLLFNSGETEEGYSDEETMNFIESDRDDYDDDYDEEDEDEEDSDAECNDLIDDEALEGETDDCESEEESDQDDEDINRNNDTTIEEDGQKNSEATNVLDDMLSASLSSRLDNWLSSYVREYKKYLKKIGRKSGAENIRQVLQDIEAELSTFESKIIDMGKSRLIDPNSNVNLTVGLEYKYRLEAYNSLINNYKRKFDEKFNQNSSLTEEQIRKAREKEAKYRDIKNNLKGTRSLLQKLFMFYSEEMEDLDGIMYNAGEVPLDKILSARLKPTSNQQLLSENEKLKLEIADLHAQLQQSKAENFEEQRTTKRDQPDGNDSPLSQSSNKKIKSSSP